MRSSRSKRFAVKLASYSFAVTPSLPVVPSFPVRQEAFRSPRDSSSRSYLALAVQEAWSLLPGPGLLLLPAALLRLLSRGREWDLSGLQTFHPVPLLCSRTPVESTCPRH